MIDNMKNNQNMKEMLFRNFGLRSICMFLVVFSFYQCTPTADEIVKEPIDMVVTEYIASKSEYSEMNDLLKYTEIDRILNIRGPYTFFLPTNDAMKAYYTEMNVQSFKNLDSTTLREFVFNHIVVSKIESSYFQFGALSSLNALGDYVVSSFDGNDILINSTAKIVKRDIIVSNGIIDVIDKVLKPSNDGVYDVLAANPGYSIFAEGLKRSGLKDTLQINSFMFGSALARTRYTILAVADTTFKRFGISDIDQLISTYSPSTSNPDSLKTLYNGFYMYMDYHCIEGGAYYTTGLSSTALTYNTFSKENSVSISFSKQVFKINYNSTTKKYNSVYSSLSNMSAKNGVIHTVDNILPSIEPAPAAILFEVTDYFDVKQGSYYLKNMQKFFDYNYFKNIKWEGEFLQYYYKPAGARDQKNYDCLNMTGFWTIEITTPKIRKGKYVLASRIWERGSTFNVAVYVDGVQVMIQNFGPAGTLSSSFPLSYINNDAFKLFDFGTYTWDETTTHKVKLVALNSGQLFWDRLEFQPVN
jgi:uncharacterized surface protein with fasciclin (FAS1) repeats